MSQTPGFLSCELWRARLQSQRPRLTARQGEWRQPYDDAFLSGFQSEAYQVSLSQGFQQAREMMKEPIRSSIERDIGGDHQRIDSVNTRYDDVTFKHILLPTWICAYRYQDRAYRFLVNARTGEVQGERPWSWVKIMLLVLTILAIIAAIALTLAGRVHGMPSQLPGM